MIKLEKFSYNFAEEVLNSRKYLKDEIEYVIENTIKHYESEGLDKLTSKNLNKSLRQSFEDKRWDSEPYVFEDEELPDQPKAKLDFLKDRIGIEAEFGHSSFLGIDLLKLQVASTSGTDQIDVGVYITATKRLQKRLRDDHNLKWEGRLDYEKVSKYLPHFKNVIHVPIYVIGIDIQ